jgi:large repetitive protein
MIGNIPTNSGYTLTGTLTGTDPDGDAISYNLIQSPINGQFTFSGSGNFSYIPNLSFSGSDIFTFQITDGTGSSPTYTGVINVIPNGSNTVPIAHPLSLMTLEDTLLNSTLSGTDDGSITYHLTLPTTHGTIQVSTGGTMIYTPDANFSGTDFFTYVVHDGIFTSTSALVTITVIPVNDAPIGNIDTFTLGSQNT